MTDNIPHASPKPCEPVLRTRTTVSLEDGVETRRRDYVAFDCACGRAKHDGAVFFVDREMALRSYERRTGLNVLKVPS